MLNNNINFLVMSDNQNQNLHEEEEKEIFSDISSESKSSHNTHRDDYDNYVDAARCSYFFGKQNLSRRVK